MNVRLTAFWDEYWQHENCMGQKTGSGTLEHEGEILGFVDDFAVIRLKSGRLQRVRISDIKTTKEIQNGN